MDLSVQLAAIIGPLLVLVGIGTMLNRDHYRKMITAFLENAELYYFSGALAFIVGLAMVLHHNLWVADWRVAITIIGWLSLLKGAVRILVPTAGKRVAGCFTETGGPLIGGSVLIIVFGAWLSFKALALLGGG